MNHLHSPYFLRDEDYLLEIKAGGLRADTAISSLYTKYRKRVYNAMARLISKNSYFKGAPADLVHDAFIILIHKIQFENVQVHTLSGFWVGIGKNLFLNQLKKDERIILVRDAEEKYGLNEVSPESEFLCQEEQEQLELIFLRLGSRCREILLLWINQFTMVEIAAQMNLSNDAMARKIKHSCFKKLKILVRKGNKMAE